MFDCGEGTQARLNMTWGWKNLTKIFITHMHGDHVFGLPGVVLAWNTESDPLKKYLPRSLVSLEIFGPVGLRDYLENCLSHCGNGNLQHYVVHEIAGKGMATRQKRRGVKASKPSRDIIHGEQKLPESDSFWTLVDQPADAHLWSRKQDRAEDIAEFRDIIKPHIREKEHLYGKLDEQQYMRVVDIYFKRRQFSGNGMRVRAGPIKHSVDTLAYTIEASASKPSIGPIGMTNILKALERNCEGLVETNWTYSELMTFLAHMQPEESFDLPDGSSLGYDDIYTEEERNVAGAPPVKISILGDTCNARPSLELIKESNVMVHEATDIAPANVISRRGHSNPTMAGKFAREAKVGSLILNHFSKKDLSMKKVRKQAANAASLPQENVLCASDFTVVNIALRDKLPGSSGLGASSHLRKENRSSKSQDNTKTVWQPKLTDEQRAHRKKRKAEIRKRLQRLQESMEEMSDNRQKRGGRE